MLIKVISIVVFHFIGAIITLIIHCKNGIMKDAAENGDGIRTAKPSDIVFFDLILWEFCLLLCIAFFIEEKIDNYFSNKYKNKEKNNGNICNW